MGAPERRAYGPTPIETLDLYRTERANAPGQYLHPWRAGGASALQKCMRSRLSSSCMPAHIGVVPNFNWVQDVGDSLMPLADQVRRAVAWVYRNAKSLVAIRSYLRFRPLSGRALAGVILTTDWQKLHDLPPDIVKGGLCCSGMFDLEPVALSARRHYIKFTDEMVEALSPSAASRQAQRPGNRCLRLARDPRIPTSVARLRCGQ